MHTRKNKFVWWLCLAASLVFCACAGSSNAPAENTSEKNAKVQAREEDKQKALELTFENFINAIKSRASADDIYEFMTDSSEYWLDTLENHAKTFTAEEIDASQFYEAYAILLYRLFEREHLWESDDDRMLHMLLFKSDLIDRFLRLNLGPMKVKNDRGSIGLAKSPDVPVMIFEWDDMAWKLDLPETLPLITKGIESIAVKKNWTSSKLALYWIEKEYRMTYSRLDESLLEPIGF